MNGLYACSQIQTCKIFAEHIHIHAYTNLNTHTHTYEGWCHIGPGPEETGLPLPEQLCPVQLRASPAHCQHHAERLSRS